MHERIGYLFEAWFKQFTPAGGMGCLLMSPSMFPSKAEEVMDRDLVLEAQTMHKYCAKRVWI